MLFRGGIANAQLQLCRGHRTPSSASHWCRPKQSPPRWWDNTEDVLFLDHSLELEQIAGAEDKGKAFCSARKAIRLAANPTRTTTTAN